MPDQTPQILRKSRRQMAWVAMVTMPAFVVLAMFVVPESKLNAITNILQWYFTVAAAIVGTYCGFATSFDMKLLKTKISGTSSKSS